ncbi:MAG: peptidase S14 [Oscillibacter sp.]|nr:peptidase S14 [Oscillibacter sp.]
MTEPTKPREPEKDAGKEMAQGILDFGSALTHTPHGAVYCLTIIGQIEGHVTASSGTKTTKYEHVLPLLAKLEESEEVDGILFLLNTVGGDVEAGLAIAELIAGMKKPTVSIVLGGSHSIGVPLAVAAKESFAVPSAAMTIHPVRMSGTVIAAPQTYHYFERLQERIVAFVAKNSRISAGSFQALMLKKDDMAADVGSVVYGEEAVRLGLIDRVGGLSDGLQSLYRQITERKEAGSAYGKGD